MTYIKDFYKILGVMPTAEDIVIRAAYKALVQRYHPDKYQGDPGEATHIMQGIVKAYKILSDPEKRKNHDAWLSQQTSGREYQTEDQGDDEFNAAMAACDRDWKTACSIHPELQEYFVWLNKIAHRLGATYKILMLETKNFQDRKTIARIMEDQFFRSYFGNNENILVFARLLVREGKKEAAKALNIYVKVFGYVIDSRRVIGAVCNEHGIQSPWKMKEEALGQTRQAGLAKQAEAEQARQVGLVRQSEQAIQQYNKIAQLQIKFGHVAVNC